MGDITPLHEVPPDQEGPSRVVQLLERLLERARAGEFHGALVLTETMGEGSFCCHWTGSMNAMTRLGALEMLKHDWLTRLGGDE